MITKEEFNRILPILYDAIHTFGGDAQLAKVEEECGELIDAVRKYRMLLRDKESCDNYRALEAEMVDETADVLVVALQSAIMVGTSAVRDRFLFKVDRLEKLIKERTDDKEETN